MRFSKNRDYYYEKERTHGQNPPLEGGHWANEYKPNAQDGGGVLRVRNGLYKFKIQAESPPV